MPGKGTPQLLAHHCPRGPEKASGTQRACGCWMNPVSLGATPGLLKRLHGHDLEQGVGGMK